MTRKFTMVGTIVGKDEPYLSEKGDFESQEFHIKECENESGKYFKPNVVKLKFNNSKANKMLSELRESAKKTKSNKIIVEFRLSGREWKGKIFTSLEASAFRLITDDEYYRYKPGDECSVDSVIGEAKTKAVASTEEFGEDLPF